MADSRKLIVEVVGDTSNLERSFRRANKSAQQFEGTIQRTGRRLSRSLIGAGAALIGTGGLVYGLQQSVKAALEAEAVLAQTEQAVKNAGLSWFQYGKRVEQVTAAQSRLSGFMDEQLLGTFSAFVRRTSDVNEALRLNALTMDIARGANIDLETASKTVLRALGGQARGLAILGVQVRKGATATELITALQDKFTGSSQRFADTAAGSFARFNVALDETKETLGAALLPTLTKYLNKTTKWLEDTENQKRLQNDLTTAVEGTAAAIDGLVSGVQALADGYRRLRDIKGPSLLDVIRGRNIPLLSGLRPLFGGGPGETHHIRPDYLNPAALSPGSVPGRGALEGGTGGGPGVSAGRKVGDNIRKGISQSLRNLWFDNSITRALDRVQDIPGLGGQKAELGRIAAVIRGQLAIVKDVTRRLNLEDQLLSVMRQQKAIQDEITAGIKEANQALRERADAIKSAVLDRLQRRQTNILNARALQDAKESLRIAQQLGGRQAIRNARRGIQDVNFDIQRARLEAAPASLAGGRFALGNVITINVNGSDSPDQVAQRVATILQRKGRHQTKQRRGPYSDLRIQ